MAEEGREEQLGEEPHSEREGTMNTIGSKLLSQILVFFSVRKLFFLLPQVASSLLFLSLPFFPVKPKGGESAEPWEKVTSEMT